MKAYLLEITRSIRGERPSETQIEIDSKAATLGDTANCSQPTQEDNYFRLDRRMDLQANVDRILSTMALSPFAIRQGHGWRAIAYPYSDRWTLDRTQPSETIEDMDGVKELLWAPVWLRRLSPDATGDVTYEGEGAMEQAFADAEAFHPSDGWVVGYEWQGKTTVVESRPSLWLADGDLPVRGAATHPMLQRSAEADRY